MRTNAFVNDDARQGAGWSSDGFQDARPARAVSHELETIFGSAEARLPPSRASGAHVQTVALGAPAASAPAVRRKLPVAAIGGGLLVVAVGSVLGLTLGSPDLNAPESTGTRTAAAPRAQPTPAPAQPAPGYADEYASAEELTPLTPMPTEAERFARSDPAYGEAIAPAVPAQRDAFLPRAAVPVATPVVAQPAPARTEPVRSATAQPSPGPVARQQTPTRVAAAPPQRNAAPRAAPAPVAVAQRESAPQPDARGGGIERPLMGARLLGGRIRNSDYPREARQAGAEGTVFVRFAVRPDGRVGGCSVTRSSGHPALDATTCRLIQKRFRYEPARDADGRRVPDVMQGRQVWWVERDGRDGDGPTETSAVGRGPSRG